MVRACALCVLILRFASVAGESAACQRAGQCDPTPLDVGVSTAWPIEVSDSLSLVQLRAQQHKASSGILPVPGTIYMLEAYIGEMRSYADRTICDNVTEILFARVATCGEQSTGCLNVTTTGDWFETYDFNDLYSVDIGFDPEIELTYTAYQNQDQDLCTWSLEDACHVEEAHLISASQVTTLNQWLPGKLGDKKMAHELFFYYKLSILTTTTTTTSTSSTTTTTTTPAPAVCKVFGDPHIIGFDKRSNFILYSSGSEDAADKEDPLGATMDNFESGDFWLVKSPLVSIQGRYNKAGNYKNSFLRVLAVGGPFLHNNTLIIGNRKSKVFWNDEEILSTLPSEYRNQFIKARYHKDSWLVQDKERDAPGIDIDLPLEVKLLVNRGKNGVGVQIVMPKMEGGQDGQCGNYNGNPADDTEELIAARIGINIVPDDLLFHRKMLREEEANMLKNGQEDSSQ